MLCMQKKNLNENTSSYLDNKNHVAKVAFSVPETLFKSRKNSNTALFENEYLNIFCPQNAVKYDKYEGKSCFQSLCVREFNEKGQDLPSSYPIPIPSSPHSTS